MINEVRKNLAKICMCITATILAAMSFICLLIFEKQFKAQQYTLLENHLNNIVFRMQTEKNISHSFLSELEVNNHLLISIEVQNTPLLFRGNTASKTPRIELFHLAKTLATTKYNFNLSPFYTSTLVIPKVNFEYTTDKGEHYLATVAAFSSQTGRFNFILLKDMTEEDHYLFLIRLLFIGLTIIGFLLLGIFSFWFSGHAIKPIEMAHQKQTEFIAAASHELRSPLAVIDTNTSALHFEQNSTDAQFVEGIHKECKRMKRLIDDLLLLANTDAHNWSIQLTPVEVDTLLINTYELFASSSRQKGLIFNLVLPDETIPPIPADEERLSQTLSIILDNAFSYTPEGGKVSLVLIKQKAGITIDVVDNGPGISDEHKGHIFDRFYRVDPARHKKEHYGLGLSIAYELIRLHKGKLAVNDTPGGGATFSIHLPL